MRSVDSGVCNVAVLTRHVEFCSSLSATPPISSLGYPPHLQPRRSSTSNHNSISLSVSNTYSTHPSRQPATTDTSALTEKGSTPSIRLNLRLVYLTQVRLTIMFLSVITRSGVAAAVRGATMSLKGYSTPVGSALSVSGRRAMMTTFQEKERGEEAVFMRKEDQKLLDALLKKERAQAVQGKTTERDELVSILGDHKLPDDIIDRLLHWKHN